MDFGNELANLAGCWRWLVGERDQPTRQMLEVGTTATGLRSQDRVTDIERGKVHHTATVHIDKKSPKSLQSIPHPLPCCLPPVPTGESTQFSRAFSLLASFILLVNLSLCALEMNPSHFLLQVLTRSYSPPPLHNPIVLPVACSRRREGQT